MALILDKSPTGVTSVDISGNTLTTGYTNLDYTDEFGNVHDNPYLVIDDVIIDKSRYFVKISVMIFKDLESRQNGKNPVLYEQKTLTNSDPIIYDKYFSMENMLNTNIFKSSYDFISTEYYISWKSDE